MMTKIDKKFVIAEELNDLYKAGYRYTVEGDYKTLGTTDPWSGMPDTTNNIYAFSDRNEAKAFAVKQIWVFNPDVHASVVEIPEHTETFAEWREKEDRKKAARKAKKEANEAKKAAEAGLTVEEYRAEHKRVALAKRVTNEITELEKDLARKKALLKELEG